MTPFEQLRQGDLVKAVVGNERLWFTVLHTVDDPANAVVCTLQSEPVSGITFDGRTTIDRRWIIDTFQKAANA